MHHPNKQQADRVGISTRLPFHLVLVQEEKGIGIENYNLERDEKDFVRPCDSTIIREIARSSR